MPIKTLSLALFAGAAVLFSGCASTISDVLAEKPVNPKNYRKSIAAPYLKGKINFDGKLDEKVWKNAGFFDDFDSAVRKCRKVVGVTEPIAENREKYLSLYEKYKKISNFLNEMFNEK